MIQFDDPIFSRGVVQPPTTAFRLLRQGVAWEVRNAPHVVPHNRDNIPHGRRSGVKHVPCVVAQIMKKIYTLEPEETYQPFLGFQRLIFVHVFSKCHNVWMNFHHSPRLTSWEFFAVGRVNKCEICVPMLDTIYTGNYW